MTTLERERVEETIEWEELAPPCEAQLCQDNPADWACKHKHFESVPCRAEGNLYLLCDSCYELIKKLPAICVLCKEPASLYAIERIN